MLVNTGITPDTQGQGDGLLPVGDITIVEDTEDGIKDITTGDRVEGLSSLHCLLVIIQWLQIGSEKTGKMWGNSEEV